MILELNEIQAGALRRRPTPYAGAYFFLRIDNRHAGRELLRRLIPALASAADPADPSRPGSPPRSLSRASKPWVCRRTPSTASHWSSSRAWPPAPPSWAMLARTPPTSGSSRLAHPTFTLCWRRLRPTPPSSRRSWPAPAKPCRSPGVARSGGRTSSPCPPSATLSASMMASASRPSKAVASPAATLKRRRSRQASSSWATKTKSATCSRRRSPRCWVATAPTWS